MAPAALRLLPGGAPDRNDCSDLCSSESTAARPKVFGPACVQPIDSKGSVSGHALRITLPLNPGFTVRGELHARCKLGGLPAKIDALTVSEDMVVVVINVPDGINLWQRVPVELAWICTSRWIPQVTFTIRGRE